MSRRAQSEKYSHLAEEFERLEFLPGAKVIELDAAILRDWEPKKVTIVIPARDEGPTITAIVRGALRIGEQVIVVDGHSRDETANLAREAGAQVILDNRKGKGDAIRCAIPHVRNEVTVFIDADGSHELRDIPRLVRPILDGRFDHVHGSRMLGGSSELHGGFDEFLRLIGSSIITLLINKKYGTKLSDSQNGFRAVRTEVLRSLDLHEDITTIEQEMVFETLRNGYRLGEVPTHEYSRHAGESKISLKKVWFQYGWCLLKGLLRPKKPI